MVLPGSYGGQCRAGKALELAAPVDDWAEAARTEGWSNNVSGTWSKAGITETYDNPESLCDQQGIDPYQWDVFEHWAVSQHLADKLIAQGERVDTDFAGLCVWARTTTGQAIHMDGVFNAIATELAGEASNE